MGRRKTWSRFIVSSSGILFWIVTVLMLFMTQVFAHWMPEGDQVAFMYNSDPGRGSNNLTNWDIYLLDVRSGVTMSLTTYPGWDRYPDWSPDGQFIAYHSDQVGTHDIYIMDAQGKHIQALNIAPRARALNEAMVAWSDDGRYIAFHSGTENPLPAEYDIYISGMDISTTRQVTFSPGVSAHAAWSPGNKHIVFASDQDMNSNTLSMSLYVLDLESDPNIRLVQDRGRDSSVRRLTFDSPDEESLFPAWSPDGEWIAYVYHYYPSLVTQQPGFSSPSPQNNQEFDQRRSLRPLPAYAGSTTAPPGASGYFQVADIYLVSPDGEKHINLTNTPFVDTTPDWLPGGDRIIFSSNRNGGDFDLYVMDADGSNVRQLTNLPGDEMAPDWRPNQ